MAAKIMIIALVCSASIMRSNFVDASPTSMERMMVSRMRMADLESSATGYAYTSQRGQPASYVQYSNHGTGGIYEAPEPVQYVTYRKPGSHLESSPPVISAIPAYGKQVAPLVSGYVVPIVPSPKNQPIAPYFVPVKVQQKPQRRLEIVDDENSHDNHYGHILFDASNERKGDSVKSGQANEEAHGNNFNAEEHSSRGEKGEKGYNNHRLFDNGEKGIHDNEKQEGHFSENAANKKAHAETSAYYDQQHEAQKGKEGESYGEHAYHKKGQKTTGFHNVYRKDEYKKDTDFYDDDHKSGHYDKYSSSDKHHVASDGDFKKGDRHDSAYEVQNKGKENHYNKGHVDNQNKGYKNEEGADSYHKYNADYAKNGGAEENKKYGYSNGYL